ncbi:hypothetical protein QBC36DRAFT_361423 [Triangularia setosa]|uniref:Uncharacterized protein n=1 Tax=Triangularia setosa TaxID=2587417 RepID=A0AAN7A592_9PEZI|nr:hypothetical protein QBC36DRAFT_361423 [Podospora setosa]
MHLFDIHHQLQLHLDDKLPLLSQIMPSHNTTSSSSSNPHPATPTPFATNHASARKQPQPTTKPSSSSSSDDNLHALPPNLACLSLSSSSQHRTIVLGLINLPPTTISTVSKLAHTSFPSSLDGKSSYIKQESKTVAWVVVGFLCGVFKELWYHGWGFVGLVQNPLEPPTVGRKVLAQRQNVDVQNLVFRFDGTREPERFDWLGMSLHKLGEVLVVGGLPARLHKKLARGFFPMGLGKKKQWSGKAKYMGYQRLSFAGRKYFSPNGAEDETVVRLLGIVEGGDEGWKLYASLGTWPGLVLFRRAREPGWRVPSRSVGSEQGVVTVEA